jgi:hypothetical protein
MRRCVLPGLFDGADYRRKRRGMTRYKFMKNEQPKEIITPLELQLREILKTKSRRQISEMLQNDFWNCYKADFKTKLDDDFNEQPVFERITVSAMIYPKCLRPHILDLNKRSSIIAQLATDETLEEFKSKEYWHKIENARRHFPHDDLYFIVPNSKLN